MSYILRNLVFILGILVGVVLLLYAVPDNGHNKKYEDLALVKRAKSSFANVDGVQVHCSDMDNLSGCINGYLSAGDDDPVALWLGNSQLHVINNFQEGDETAVPESHRLLRPLEAYLVALSQPNANLQEHYVIFAHLLNVLPVEILVLPVVFDDMREDGLRMSLAGMLDYQGTHKILGQTAVGNALLANNKQQDVAGNKSNALADTVQERVENYLNNKLSENSLLWKTRPGIRGGLYNFAYRLRNWVFNIKPTTVRRIIPGRYTANLNALKEIVSLAVSKGVSILVYVPPLRNDVKIPYNLSEYLRFKDDVASVLDKRGVYFVDFEDLVPNEFWGTKSTTGIGKDQELDFMHFKSEGHRLLARALYEKIKDIDMDGRDK